MRDGKAMTEMAVKKFAEQQITADLQILLQNRRSTKDLPTAPLATRKVMTQPVGKLSSGAAQMQHRPRFHRTFAPERVRGSTAPGRQAALRQVYSRPRGTGSSNPLSPAGSLVRT